MIDTIGNAPVGVSEVTDVSKAIKAIKAGAALDDEIDNRVAQIDYIENVAYKWNPDVTAEQIQDLRKRLIAKSDTLDDALSDIANLKSQKADLPFAYDDIPMKPKGWIARDLKEVGRISKNISNNRWSFYIDKPALYDDQRMQIELDIDRVTIGRGDPAELALDWEFEDGRPAAAALPRVELGRETFHQKKTVLVTPPAGSRRLRLGMISYGGWIMSVTLVLRG